MQHSTEIVKEQGNGQGRCTKRDFVNYLLLHLEAHNLLFHFSRRLFDDAFGWEGVVGRSGSIADLTTVSHRFAQGGVVVARRFVAHLENTENGADSLTDFVDGPIVGLVDDLERFDHSSNVLDAVGQLFLLILEDFNQAINFVQAAFTLHTTRRRLHNGIGLVLRHQSEWMMDGTKTGGGGDGSLEVEKKKKRNGVSVSANGIQREPFSHKYCVRRRIL